MASKVTDHPTYIIKLRKAGLALRICELLSGLVVLGITAELVSQTSWMIANLAKIFAMIGTVFSVGFGDFLTGLVDWSLKNQYMPKWGYCLAVACLDFIVSLTLLVYAARRHRTQQQLGRLMVEQVVDLFMCAAWLAAAILIFALVFLAGPYEIVAGTFAWLSFSLYTASAIITHLQHKAELAGREERPTVVAHAGPEAA